MYIFFSLVCKEKHADGEPHLHAVISLERRVDITDSRKLDEIAGSHGNYRVVRSLVAAKKYCEKDGVYYVVGHLKQGAVKDRVTDVIALRIKEDGASYATIANDFPGFALLHGNLIKSFVAEQTRSQCLNRSLKKSWSPIDVQTSWPKSWRQIATWLNANMDCVRPPRKKQLYLWGPSRTSKSSLLKWLSSFFTVFEIPKLNGFVDGFADDYEVLYFDEFAGQHPLSWLNRFVEGYSVELNVKGGSVTKKKNHPVIIVSNASLQHWYRAQLESILQPLLNRFLSVEVGTYCPWDLDLQVVDEPCYDLV